MVTMWDAREDTGQPKQFSDIIRSTKNLAALVGIILLFRRTNSRINDGYTIDFGDVHWGIGAMVQIGEG
jgi:hypothetical protein